MWALFIILGVAVEIVKVNELLIIPNIAEYIFFGLGGLLMLAKLIVYLKARREYSNISKRMRINRKW